MIDYYVTHAIPFEDYKIIVKFRDGSTKIVDMEPTIFKDKHETVFTPLKDKEFFKTFWVGEHKDTIYWENEIDISPEYLYKNGKPLKI